jgi:transposase InsO family protein
MEARLLAACSGDRPAVPVSVLCRELEISRQTFYKYRKRFRQEGPAGLVERSRRPQSSPALITADLEDEIVRLRKELPLDNGAQTIAYHLERAGWAAPSVSTIHRALVRRGLVTPQPQKRPRSAWRRFEWPQPNDAWQIDATCWTLSSGREMWIMDILDDHSRVVTAARVATSPTSDAAWQAFCDGVDRYGLPAHVMSDNGACFTARYLSGGECEFEENLAALGIRHLLSSPAHPQTCGKLERFHQTLKRWLRTQPLARRPIHLQRQLDEFLAFYNQQRPHRALQGATPAERWNASTPAAPGEPLKPSPRASLHTVGSTGHIAWRRYQIGVGSPLARQQVLVIARGDNLTVFGHTGLIRRLTLDRSRRYQPSGLPPGPRRRT